MLKKASCACVGGHVLTYLKNEDAQRVHIAVSPCGVCNSDSSEVPESTEGGVKIEEKEYYGLRALGWDDPDI